MKTTTRSLKEIIAKYSRIIILCLICLVLSILSDKFFTYDNIINVLRQGSLLIIMAIGMTFAMLLGKGVDLSIGSVVALTSCVAAPYLTNGSSPQTVVFGLMLAAGVGVLVGTINGMLITYIKLPGFLVTFGMREIARGVVYLIMHGRIISGFVPGIVFLGAGQIFSIPVPVVIAAFLTIAASLVLKYTRFGREVYIVGANTNAARFSGIHVNASVMKGFAISSLCATLAGIVYIARLNTAEAIIGGQFALQAIGAVAIGGISFDGGIGNPFGAVIGALILTLLTNGMNLLNVASEWQTFVNGSIIILAVVLDRYLIKTTR